jgi:hypothetical protein
MRFTSLFLGIATIVGTLGLAQTEPGAETFRYEVGEHFSMMGCLSLNSTSSVTFHSLWLPTPAREECALTTLSPVRHHPAAVPRHSLAVLAQGRLSPRAPLQRQ